MTAPALRSAPVAGPVRPATPTRLIWRIRLFAVCLALTVGAFAQDAGLTSPDTKLDLPEDALGFMGRALHLWDPEGFFGQLQNQAYGYFFPMGPFFSLGSALNLPPWVTQRAWHALLLVTAFLGFVRLAGRLGIGDSWSRVIAGIAYALAPRMISVLGTISSEAMPMALAPWVLLPLVGASCGGPVRRAAARSGIAVLLTGAVNAVATLAVLPLPALWLLTRERGRRRTRLATAWAGAVGLASVWWAVPLVLLGRYSPPFLDWIETSSTTTSPTSLFEVLRGTSHWVARVTALDGPIWPAGWAMLASPGAVFATAALAALGLAGLARRDLPHRTFLITGLAVGLVLVTFGHVGPATPPWAAGARDLLDGALSPFRNVHKWEPVVRLPLVLGLAHLVAAPRRRLVDLPVIPYVRAIAACLVLVTATPVLASSVVPAGRYVEIPPYWRAAADWLAAEKEPGRALLTPGSPFPTYLWGQPADEPMQVLARRPWAVRNAVPLGHAGNVRYLDAFERRLATGYGSAGVSDFLARGGVRFLVVRNDLDWIKAGSPRPELVHETLSDSPGITRVASFGPDVGALNETDSTTVDHRTDGRYPAVEIFRVDRRVDLVRAYDAGHAVRMSGGPEGILALADRGLTDRAVILAADEPPVPQGFAAVTDTLRRREMGFGGSSTSASATLDRDSPYRVDRPVHDYDVTPRAGYLTVGQPIGIRAVSASSSASDVDAVIHRSPSRHVWAALDGEPGTSWVSGSFRGAVGQWYEVELAESRDLSAVRVSFGGDADFGPLPTRMLVETDRGSELVTVQPTTLPQDVRVVPGQTTHIRLTVAAVSGGGRGVSAAISELVVPGVHPQRTLSVPTSGAAQAPIVALDVADGGRDACLHTGGDIACSHTIAAAGEEDLRLDRTVPLEVAGQFQVSAVVRARPGDELTSHLRAYDGRLHARASSTDLADPARRAQAAVDGDPRTGWLPGPLDVDPALTISWERERSITGLRFELSPSLAAARPKTVAIAAAGGSWRGDVDADGYVRFPAVSTDELVIRFETASPVTSLDRGGGSAFLPVGVSEVDVLGAEDLAKGPSPQSPFAIECGQGPKLRLDGRVLRMRVRGSVDDVVTGRPLNAESCDGSPVTLELGSHRIELAATGSVRPQSVTLQPVGQAWPASEPSPEVRTLRWGAARRTVDVAAAAGSSYLAVRENFSPAWRAQLGGRTLEAVRIDGWQQGWLVPASGGQVELTFVPDRPYRVALGLGSLAALILAGLAVRRERSPRADLAPALPAGVGPLVAVVIGVGILVLLGGWAGLGVGLAASAYALVQRGASRYVGPLAAGLMLFAGLAAAVRPWAGGSPPAAESLAVQLLCLGALAAVAASVAAGRSDGE
jgi:arabinofuranan 3-O-arabinosyltransferase